MFNNLWLNIVAIFPENRSNILFSFFFLELILYASVKSIKKGNDFSEFESNTIESYDNV